MLAVRSTVLASALALGLALHGCGDESDDSASTISTTQPPSPSPDSGDGPTLAKCKELSGSGSGGVVVINSNADLNIKSTMGNGTIKRATRTLKNAKDLGGFLANALVDVTLKLGDGNDATLDVETDENLLDLIFFGADGGYAVVSTCGNVCPTNTKNRVMCKDGSSNSAPIPLTVTLPKSMKMHMLHLLSSSSLTAADNITLKKPDSAPAKPTWLSVCSVDDAPDASQGYVCASGSAEANLAAVDASSLALNVMNVGSASIKTSGAVSSEDISFIVMGSTNTTLDSVKNSGDASFHVTGSAEVSIGDMGAVSKVDASGSSELEVKSAKSIASIAASGSASVKFDSGSCPSSVTSGGSSEVTVGGKACKRRSLRAAEA